jgi:mannose-1-phosphate guanylyltransferase
VEANHKALVTFGVTPDRPSTGFGYLELGNALEEGQETAKRVVRFREKPDAESATAFVADGPGKYLWNSACSCGAPRASSSWFIVTNPNWPRLFRASHRHRGEPASKDPEVLVAALPLSIEWLDIGSWPAYGELLPQDSSGNASLGETALVESSGLVAVSTEAGHLVACLGCEDLVVVHTPDATLVCPKARADELKKLYAVVAGKEGGKYR